MFTFYYRRNMHFRSGFIHHFTTFQCHCLPTANLYHPFRSISRSRQISSENQGPQLRFAEGNEASTASGDISIDKLARLVERTFRSLSTPSAIPPSSSQGSNGSSNSIGTSSSSASSLQNVTGSSRSSSRSSGAKTKELRIAGLLFDACATIRELR